MKEYEQKIKVETPMGNLFVECSGDPEHPGVYVFIQKENGDYRDLLGAEYCDAYYNKNKNFGERREESSITTYLWGDPKNESWTKCHTFFEKDLWEED